MQAKEGDCSTDFLLNLSLPVRESLTIILEFVIGFEALLKLGEELVNRITVTKAINVHGQSGVLSSHSGLQNVHGVIQLGAILEDLIDRLVVLQIRLSLFHIRQLFR